MVVGFVWKKIVLHYNVFNQLVIYLNLYVAYRR